MHRQITALGMVAALWTHPVWAGDTLDSVDALGLSVGVSGNFTRISHAHTSSGKRRPLDDRVASSWLALVDGSYGLDAIAQGLRVGGRIPVLRASEDIEPGDSADGASFGVGDAELWLEYLPVVSQQGFRIGARIAAKAATGSTSEVGDGDAPLGNGHHHVRAALRGESAPHRGFGMDFAAGYVLTASRTAHGVRTNPGDVLFGDIGISYTLSNRIRPRVTLLYQRQGPTRTGLETGAMRDKDQSDGFMLGVLADVTYDLTDVFQIYAAWGGTGIAEGYGLRYGGLPIAGRNARATLAAFTLGATRRL